MTERSTREEDGQRAHKYEERNLQTKMHVMASQKLNEVEKNKDNKKIK